MNKGIALFAMIFSSKPTYNICSEKLLFFHIPKTAGTTFSALLYGLAKGINSKSLFVPIKINKQIILKNIQKNPNFIEEIIYQNRFIFGHSANYLWPHVKEKFKLITLLRDPVDQFISHYFWKKRNDNLRETISEKDFLKYMEDENCENNLMCKWLINGFFTNYKASSLNESELFQSAMLVLKENFYLITTTNKLVQFGSRLLSAYGGPNLDIPEIKKELDPRKLEFKKNFKTKIIDFNQADLKLYKYVKENQLTFWRNLPSPGSEKSKKTLKVNISNQKKFNII